MRCWSSLLLRAGVSPATSFLWFPPPCWLRPQPRSLIAVVFYFLALSEGPASVVVPIYGMFIVGGAILGLIFLHEPFTLRKALGILLAAISVYLIAGHPTP
ncbi:MAG: hypothetical protein DME42_00060 [Verrucomicrobia bacterium]|nr:MAG: hypothetical protein DME42_00060 [Verrucomicrobiota bacterium]